MFYVYNNNGEQAEYTQTAQGYWVAYIYRNRQRRSPYQHLRADTLAGILKAIGDHWQIQSDVRAVNGGIG